MGNEKENFKSYLHYIKLTGSIQYVRYHREPYKFFIVHMQMRVCFVPTEGHERILSDNEQNLTQVIPSKNLFIYQIY